MMKKKKKSSGISKSIFYLFLFATLFIGFSVGLLTANILFPQKISPSLLLRESGYEFINPLIDFDNIDFIKTKDAKNLEKTLNNYVKREIRNNSKIDKISIYYRGLNAGVWAGVNERDTYTLASLTKVATMITHFKYDEQNPGHLETKYIYTYNPEEWIHLFDDNRTEGYELEEGKEYTIDEFIAHLIITSDNSVLPYLYRDEHISNRELDKIFSDLSITNPYTSFDENVYTVREYSSFFRILYNSTYLSKEMSSKALMILSESIYDYGIARGIPENIVLANKFGERTYLTDNGNIEQLHDCGIVYHPTKPYVLCIMTKGKNATIQEKVISEISRIVYEIVDKK